VTLKEHYTEALDVIQNLGDKIQYLEEQIVQKDAVLGSLAREGIYHKALLSRAADALESYHQMLLAIGVDCNTCELVAELRKAAE
jgi:hypothetical protein